MIENLGKYFYYKFNQTFWTSHLVNLQTMQFKGANNMINYPKNLSDSNNTYTNRYFVPKTFIDNNNNNENSNNNDNINKMNAIITTFCSSFWILHERFKCCKEVSHLQSVVSHLLKYLGWCWTVLITAWPCLLSWQALHHLGVPANNLICWYPVLRHGFTIWLLI